MPGLSACGRRVAGPLTAAAPLLLGCLVALCVLLVLRRHAGDAAALPSYRRLAAAAASAAALAPASDAAGTARADLAAARALLEAWPRDKPRACITVLARNSDLEGVLHSVGQLERRFNARPANRYPYCYLNEKPFSAAFRHAVAAATQAPVLFGLVPAEHWSYPPHINQTRAAEVRAAARERMPYGGSESYRFMCRWGRRGWCMLTAALCCAVQSIKPCRSAGSQLAMLLDVPPALHGTRAMQVRRAAYCSALHLHASVSNADISRASSLTTRCWRALTGTGEWSPKSTSCAR
jgi:hypothetical protein